jgi:SNF2 family DNA or RNA helicase
MWEDKPEAPMVIQQVMQPNIRYKKEDVLSSLPPVVTSSRSTELTKEQFKLYAEMKEQMIALTKENEVVTADQKAALISKLFQIALGTVITDNGIARLDNRLRVDLIEELIKSTERKTVIFVSFVAAIDDLVTQLNNRKIKTVKVDGSVTGNTRDNIFRDFQKPGGTEVLVAHPITTAYGVELAAADQLILNGPLVSGTHTYMQGIERLSSAKQESDSISIVELTATEEERYFFSQLNKKTGKANATAKLFELIVKERKC